MIIYFAMKLIIYLKIYLIYIIKYEKVVNVQQNLNLADFQFQK